MSTVRIKSNWKVAYVLTSTQIAAALRFDRHRFARFGVQIRKVLRRKSHRIPVETITVDLFEQPIDDPRVLSIESQTISQRVVALNNSGRPKALEPRAISQRTPIKCRSVVCCITRNLSEKSLHITSNCRLRVNLRSRCPARAESHQDRGLSSCSSRPLLRRSRYRRRSRRRRSARSRRPLETQSTLSKIPARSLLSKQRQSE